MSLPTVEAQLTGIGVVAIENPTILKLLDTSSVWYQRSTRVVVGARRTTVKDMESPLITYVTDLRKNIFIETIKTFSKAEIESGVIILRYPDPICGQQYNEWYVTEKEWKEKYEGNPGEAWGEYKAKGVVMKNGLDVTPEIIGLLGGKNGRAEIIPSWGGTMWVFEDGLLTKDGTAIAPRILANYYFRIPKTSDGK